MDLEEDGCKPDVLIRILFAILGSKVQNLNEHSYFYARNLNQVNLKKNRKKRKVLRKNPLA